MGKAMSCSKYHPEGAPKIQQVDWALSEVQTLQSSCSTSCRGSIDPALLDALWSLCYQNFCPDLRMAQHM